MASDSTAKAKNIVAQHAENKPSVPVISKEQIKVIQNLPATVEIVKTPVIEVAVKEMPENHSDSHFPEWLLVVGTFLLVAVTGALAVYTYRLFRATVDLGIEAKNAGAEQAIQTKAALDLSTLAVSAAQRSAVASTQAERAYVTASVMEPGVKWRQDNRNFEIHIAIQNHGRTPATVSDVVIGKQVRENGEELGIPELRYREYIPKAFLVPTDSFPHFRNFWLSDEEYDAVHASSKKLWIFWYVDYIDTFGIRHRSGCARQFFDIVNSKNNLISVQEGTKRYDYDRLRTVGEGNDW